MSTVLEAKGQNKGPALMEQFASIGGTQTINTYQMNVLSSI